MKNKRGTILAETIIFISLNLIFLTILILFIMKQGSGAVVLEQAYAKQIALLIDSAQPGMTLKLNMQEGKKRAEKNGLDFGRKGEIVSIRDNIVRVRLSEEGGYEYSFFNDVDVSPYPAGEFYIIQIGDYNG